MWVKLRRSALIGLIAACLSSWETGITAAGALASAAADSPFLVKPYLQLGDSAADRSGPGDLVLVWQTEDREAPWSVAVQTAPDGAWRTLDAPTWRQIAVTGVTPHRVYRNVLRGLEAGGTFHYRVLNGQAVVFSAEARAKKGPGQPYRFVAFGDCAAGTPAQKMIASRAYEARPDFVVIPGDIVYSRGRVSEYREKYWPVYNSEEASPAFGAPLLRSTLTVAAPGNHDIAAVDLEKYPDGLAYFYYWDQPLNGPVGRAGNNFVAPLVGPASNQKAFLNAAGSNYPRMANFSFDYGNAHWTVIDSNPYGGPPSAELKSWVERDLIAAQRATWRFVLFHHPGFNSAKSHFDQQQMRLMAPALEAGKADIVFNGHVHNYQRSYPLRFVPDPLPTGISPRLIERISGHWTLDKTFDGHTRTQPDGVIYVVTGAGGAKLYNPEQQDVPGSWQEFTHKYFAKVNSLTIVDVQGPRLTVRQVSAEGEELDRFTVTKP
jgi:3',5'-cyclic AMP phosphodiesterase CpdA